MDEITPQAIQLMVQHWLDTPENGYLGASYGQGGINALLQVPHAAGRADAIIKKLMRDVPLLAALPSGSVNIYSQATGIDRSALVFEVAGQLIPIEYK
jgi:hypothetical protein